MPRSPFWISAALTASAVAWSSRLALDPEPLGAVPGAVLGADLALLAVVAVAGLLVARGRWARYLAISLSVVWLGLGAWMPLDPLGAAATVVAGAALAGTAGPWLTRGWLRHRPSADGPPVAAVAMMLGLLALPGVVALAGHDGLGGLEWALAGLAVPGCWAVGRGVTAGLWAVRLALPLLAAAAGVAAGFPNGLATVGAGLAVAAVSWRRDVGVSVSPIAPEPARRVPIPPELVPPEILEAAGYDERGRPAEPRR